jgi:hypothetical protein
MVFILVSSANVNSCLNHKTSLYAGNSVSLDLRGKRHGQFDKCYSEPVELLTDHGFNRRQSFDTITALGLLKSVYFCNVLSLLTVTISNFTTLYT